MRIIITGGHGFFGSHLVDFFKVRDCDVFAPQRDHFDLRYSHACAAAFDVFPRPDVVIHAAATVGGIGANRTHPANFLEDNLLLNTNVIMQARRHGTKKVIGIGSVCGYPHTPANIPFIEDDFFGPYPESTNAPYGYTKRVLLMQLEAEARQYGLNWSFLIPTNLYGPRDNFDLGSSHVIPAVIAKMHTAKETGNPPSLWGTGSPSRDFLYVVDACDAIYKMATHQPIPEPINIGSGDEITIAALADLISEVVGYTGPIYWDESQPDGQPRRVLDISKADEKLNWRPTVDLSTGLDLTYRYYREAIDANK